jgi:hypothetical protein
LKVCKIELIGLGRLELEAVAWQKWHWETELKGMHVLVVILYT